MHWPNANNPMTVITKPRTDNMLPAIVTEDVDIVMLPSRHRLLLQNPDYVLFSVYSDEDSMKHYKAPLS